MLRELEEQHEFSVENDLFGSLGTGAAFYLLPIGSLMSMPGIVGVLELDDSESLQRGLDGLLGLLQQQAGGDFEIKYKPYRDAPLWYFSFTGDSPIPISPSLAIVEDHLLVTLTSVRAKKEIKRVLAGASELHPVMASLTPPPQSANAVGYMDWGSLFEGAYEGGRAVLGFMGGADLPFDVTSLPEAALFTDFYEPTVLWSRLDEDAIYTRVESSFGPETALGLAALGGAAFLGFQAFMEGAHVEQAEEIEAVEADPDELEPDSSGRYPEDATAEAMDFLSTRLAVFRLETGAYPGELAALVEPTENYPRGFLDGGAVPQDGWGRAFVYAVSDDATTYRLWSIGDDGVDQGGEGDDLLHQ
jgi:hypothetical protein